MKNLGLFFFLINILFITKIFAQNEPDVGNVYWSWTIEQVIQTERPLIPDRRESNLLRYNKIELPDGKFADISYHFTNGRLSKVRYRVYGRKNSLDWSIPGPGGRQYDTGFAEKVKYTYSTFLILRRKGYQCRMGWYFPDGGGYYANYTKNQDDYENCNTDKNTVNNVFMVFRENILTMNKPTYRIAFGLENARTNLNFYFDEYCFIEKTEYCGSSDFERNRIIYTPWFLMIYKPSSSIRIQEENRRF